MAVVPSPGLARHCHGPHLTTATWHSRKNFSQWVHSFLWKLRCHWLKGLWQRQITVVRQGPEVEASSPRQGHLGLWPGRSWGLSPSGSFHNAKLNKRKMSRSWGNRPIHDNPAYQALHEFDRTTRDLHTPPGQIGEEAWPDLRPLPLVSR